MHVQEAVIALLQISRVCMHLEHTEKVQNMLLGLYNQISTNVVSSLLCINMHTYVHVLDKVMFHTLTPGVQ